MQNAEMICDIVFTFLEVFLAFTSENPLALCDFRYYMNQNILKV